MRGFQTSKGLWPQLLISLFVLSLTFPPLLCLIKDEKNEEEEEEENKKHGVLGHLNRGFLSSTLS